MSTNTDLVVIVQAMNRLSTAIEAAVLTALDNRGAFAAANSDPYPTQLPIPPEPEALTALPPLHAPAVPTSAGCPVHNVAWKLVPAGISKKTGNPYTEFLACPTTGCTQRPPR